MVRMHSSKGDNIQEIWARIGQVGGGGKNGARTSFEGPGFLLAIPDDFSSTSQRLIVIKFGYDTWDMPHWNISEGIFEKFPSFAPKNIKIDSVKHGPYSDQPTAY